MSLRGSLRKTDRSPSEPPVNLRDPASSSTEPPGNLPLATRIRPGFIPVSRRRMPGDHPARPDCRRPARSASTSSPCRFWHPSREVRPESRRRVARQSENPPAPCQEYPRHRQNPGRYRMLPRNCHPTVKSGAQRADKNEEGVIRKELLPPRPPPCRSPEPAPAKALSMVLPCRSPEPAPAKASCKGSPQPGPCPVPCGCQGLLQKSAPAGACPVPCHGQGQAPALPGHDPVPSPALPGPCRPGPRRVRTAPQGPLMRQVKNWHGFCIMTRRFRRAARKAPDAGAGNGP
jgi:hypothetical protein